MLSLRLWSGFRYLLSLCCIFSFSSLLQAQTSEADIKARLADKPLYLRGGWSDDTLRFDSSGKLEGGSAPLTFTLSGFELIALHLQPDKLVMEGRRIGLELAEDKQKRVPLKVGKKGRRVDESMLIEVATSPNGDYGPALNAIFANGLAEVAPSLPFFWTAYAAKYFTLQNSSVATPSSMASNPDRQTACSPDIKPLRLGGPIKPPKLLDSKELEFSPASVALRYDGDVLVNLCVEPDGTVSNISLIHALGLELDERAVWAVQNYVFSPATLNDKPVAVEMNIKINFRTH
jgi:TonB family protein